MVLRRRRQRSYVSSTTLQPFLSYNTKTYTTVGFVSESSYDWNGEQWTVPLIFKVAQMLKVGPQIFQLTVAAKYWADSPNNGPTGWGWRVQLTLLYPKK